MNTSKLLVMLATVAVVLSPQHAHGQGCFTMDEWASRVSTTKIDCVSGPTGQTIPPELSNLQQLQHMDVCSSNLAGTIPSLADLKKLTHLALCDNALTGTIQVKQRFAILSQILPTLNNPMLEYLDVSNNLMAGTLHRDVFDDVPMLSTLRLENNKFYGSTPASFTNLPLLGHLSMQNNDLTGTISAQIYTFPSLSTLTLSGNRFDQVTPLAEIWDKYNSDVPANTSMSEFTRNGGDCTANSECANFRCAPLTKKCCAREIQEACAGDLLGRLCPCTTPTCLCESETCKGIKNIAASSRGKCNDAWYTDYFGVAGVDAIDIVSTTGVSPSTVPMDVLYTMADLTALRLVGSGVINGMAALTNLKKLTISNPSPFTGDVNPLNSSLTSLSNLEWFEYGAIASELLLDTKFAEAWTNLKHLDIQRATMSAFVYKLSTLTALHMSNALDTTWPVSFGLALPSLETFKVSASPDMQLSSNAFAGSTRLKSLTLDRMSVTSLPRSIFNLGSLTELVLSSCLNVAGTLPSLVTLSNLKSLTLTEISSLTGSVPGDIATLIDLEQLSIMSMSNLNGSLADNIGDLTKLEHLQLSSNPMMTSPLPASISSLSKLTYLELSGSNFLGTLPSLSSMEMLTILEVFNTAFESLAGLAYVPKLVFADISSNPNIVNESSIANFHMPSLKVLGFHQHHDFEGLLNVVDTWNMPNLEFLYLMDFDKAAIGPLPTFSGFGKLTEILWAVDKFSGTLPSAWGSNLRKLTKLNMNGNFLSGTIPASFAGLTELQDLRLSNCGIVGTFPYELSQLSKLTRLDIRQNSFVGTLPDFVSTFAGQGKTFYVQTNQFVGPLPRIDNLSVLHAQDNLFTGTLPPEYPASSKLRELNLDNNKVTGIMPDGVASLTTLSIRNNMISGTLPAWATNKVKTLNIDDNKFSGTIPNPSATNFLRQSFFDGGNRWVDGIPVNLKVGGNSDVLQTKTWHYIASGKSCEQTASPTPSGGGAPAPTSFGDTASQSCTAGVNMCATNNKNCCARIGKGKTCPTGYCAPFESPNPGKCARSCKRGGGDASCPAQADEGVECATDRCVEGAEWCAGIGDYGPYGVCCGANGVDTACINKRANAISGIYDNNWCMTCTGDKSSAVTGCSLPVKPPANGKLDILVDGTEVSHIRCRINDGNDPNTAQITDDSIGPNLRLEYLALTGIEVLVTMLGLADNFANLRHLDLAGATVTGLLLSSNVVGTWSQMEYMNVSTCTSLCKDGNGAQSCFHSDLSSMSNLEVLDMSYMEFTSQAEFKKIGLLTGLKELHVNNNALTSIPDNFFDDLVALTKLRIKNTNIPVPLPDSLYDRPGFDCDVTKGSSPDGSVTRTPKPTTGSPTKTFRPSTSPSHSPSTALAPTNKQTPGPTDKSSDASFVLGSLSLPAGLVAVVIVVFGHGRV